MQGFVSLIFAQAVDFISEYVEVAPITKLLKSSMEQELPQTFLVYG
jgi:hypothetical protein